RGSTDMAALKILGAGPVKRGITQLAAQFEKSTGHKVAVEFAGAPSVRERVLAGEAVDVAVVPQSAMEEFVAQGKVAADTRTTVGRSRMGLAVRKGAASPDLSNVDAFRQTVDAADAVVVNVASSGNHVVKLLEKLGFDAGRKAVKQPDTVKVMEHVAASAQNLLGAGQLPEIRELADKGVAIELAGPLPDDLQSVTAYDAAVTGASANAGVAAEFTKFLGTPAARTAMSTTGID
ncbi:MAG: substrate-binding domain-containing protein, partial [Burkholderiales bacterium]|nr:substrate-binding domain-containing protein [Burkholderiales bacterium]